MGKMGIPNLCFFVIPDSPVLSLSCFRNEAVWFKNSFRFYMIRSKIQEQPYFIGKCKRALGWRAVCPCRIWAKKERSDFHSKIRPRCFYILLKIKGLFSNVGQFFVFTHQYPPGKHIYPAEVVCSHYNGCTRFTNGIEQFHDLFSGFGV